ncbi:MAG: hypothetical protein H0V08_06210 [Thermoleophilaceae bacterium]|nr:hypothetical protein [Thermoleophilaceae bacterium]
MLTRPAGDRSSDRRRLAVGRHLRIERLLPLARLLIGSRRRAELHHQRDVAAEQRDRYMIARGKGHAVVHEYHGH